ncbi:hypothetical protein AGMMS50267_14430 [Spirochaetia bacterium]|nr:hypothetical protein AGMMS50267_14430 [Spirochaetia bacterium]
MTDRKNLVCALLTAFLFASCLQEEDYGTTVIEISNNSSHNLYLSFKSQYDSAFEFADVAISREQSVSVKKTVAFGGAFDPNWDFESVTFLSRDLPGTSAKKPAEGLFVFKGRGWLSKYEEQAVYSLTITDEMLGF